MGLLGKIVYVSDHGTSQGVIPRFFLHFDEMNKMAFGNDQSRKQIYQEYYDKYLNNFTNFYDSYHLIIKLRKEYIDGIISGLYYKKFENGEFTADKSPEVKIKKAIKDFFKDGKPLLSNFAKSALIDDGVFELTRLLVVSPKNYEKAKAEISPQLNLKGYAVLFQLIEDAQKEFKKDFFEIRDDFEHNSLQIPDFEMQQQDNTLNIIDPKLNGENIFKLIDRFYYKTFDLIEDLAAYFFGIHACHKTNGAITLFWNKGKVDPSRFIYRYKLTFDVNDPELTKLISN